MLNESDRRRLAEIEWSLRLDDPRWVHRFERRRSRRGWRLAGVLALVCAGLTLVGVGIAYRLTGLAVLGLAVAAVATGVWLTYGRRRGHPRGPRRGRSPRGR